MCPQAVQLRSSVAWLAVDARGGHAAVRDVGIVLIGVVAGALLSALTQRVEHHLAKRRRRQHLISIMCSILDDFCSQCRDAMEEEGNELTVHRGVLVPSPKTPAFPSELDWTTIDQDWVRRFLKLRLAVPRLDERLKHILEELANPPEYHEMFDARRERCGEFLQEASDLAAALRKKARPPIWDADPEVSTA